MKALVTGAAHGLGRALTEQLLEGGHDVVALDRDIDSLEKLAVSSRGACRAYLVDMANSESIARFFDRTHEMTFDLVILNAGISATGSFEDIPSGAYERLIAVNATAPIRMAAQLVGAAHMNPKSRIVFISSLSHAVGYPGASVYAATKDAIAVYAKSVRKPFKKRGVRVLTVFPGPIRTDHAERYAPPGSKASKRMDPDKLAKMILKAAKGKAWELWPGTAAQLAKMAASMAPNLTLSAMKRAIYDKLDRPTY
ncbi:MAG: SDR family oxidoreductase [Pseudomonadota bacterium]